VTASVNPMGSVSSGRIVLKAPLAPVRLGFYEESPDDLLPKCRVGELRCGHEDRLVHGHGDGCWEWNCEEWAVLDLA
jgi:hypothetical protein